MQLHTPSQGRAFAAIWFLSAILFLVGCQTDQSLQVDGVDAEVEAVAFSAGIGLEKKYP